MGSSNKAVVIGQAYSSDLYPLDVLIGPWDSEAELLTFLRTKQSTATLANLKEYHQFFIKNNGHYNLYQGTGTETIRLLQTDVKDSAVTEAKLAASSVTESKIADSAVTTAKINTGAVTTDKIGALAVTDAKLASSSVTTDKVASGAITTVKLASEVQTTINSKATSTALSNEVSRATAAEAALQTAVTNEASARATAITNLSTSVTQQIAAEASARQNSDEDITTSIGTKTSSCASYSDVWAAISAVKGTADAGLHPTGGTVALTDSYDPTKGTSDSMAATPMCVADALSQTPKYTVVDSATSKAQFTTQGGDNIYPKTYSANVLTADESSNIETELAKISAKVGEFEADVFGSTSGGDVEESEDFRVGYATSGTLTLSTFSNLDVAQGDSLSITNTITSGANSISSIKVFLYNGSTQVGTTITISSQSGTATANASCNKIVVKANAVNIAYDSTSNPMVGTCKLTIHREASHSGGIADGTTIELSIKKLSVKDSAITPSKLASSTIGMFVGDITASSYGFRTFNERFSFPDYDYTHPWSGATMSNKQGATYSLSRMTFRGKRVFEAHLDSSNLSGQFRLTASQQVNLIGTEIYCLYVYVRNASALASVIMNMQTVKDGASQNISNTFTSFKDGWNELVWNFATMPIEKFANFDKASLINITATASSETDVYVGEIMAVRPQKAKILIVDDHGYQSFYQNAFPRLKAIGIPVTFGIQPGRLGALIDDVVGSLLSQDDIDSMRNDPMIEFSFHSWNSGDSYDASSDSVPSVSGNNIASIIDAKSEVQKCISYLRSKGICPQYLWRSAWKQNAAVFAMQCCDMLDGGAYWNGFNSDSHYYDTINPNHFADDGSYITRGSDGGPTSLPLNNGRYRIPRKEIHGKELSWYQSEVFNRLKCTHGLYVLYTHGWANRADRYGMHVIESDFANFISCLTTAVNEGWIEGVTYSQLRTRYGKIWED